MAEYMEKNHKNFRYERKYLIARSKVPEMLRRLYINGYHEIFNTREINNIYYDNFLLDSYYENIDGLSNRKKYRIRWYGKTYEISDKKLEIKVKSEFLNIKKTINLGSFKFESPIDSNLKKISIITKNELRELSINTDIFPVLKNNYTRNYYLNKNKNIRVTIDKDMCFYSFQSKKKAIVRGTCIVEFKYSKKDAFAINDLYDLRLNKSSKYVYGVEQTMNL